MEAIESNGDLEAGELTENGLLPITIEADDSEKMEATTRWLQSLQGVEFVDVVFVHFEESPTDDP